MNQNSFLFYLQNSAEDGEWKSSYRAEPQPNFCKEEVQWRAIDNSIDLLACNLLCTIYISVAEKGYDFIPNLNYAMHHEGVSYIGHYYAIFANILLAHGAHDDSGTAAKEWQHALSIDRHAHGLALEQGVAYNGE